MPYKSRGRSTRGVRRFRLKKRYRRKGRRYTRRGRKFTNRYRRKGRRSTFNPVMLRRYPTLNTQLVCRFYNEAALSTGTYEADIQPNTLSDPSGGVSSSDYLFRDFWSALYNSLVINAYKIKIQFTLRNTTLGAGEGVYIMLQPYTSADTTPTIPTSYEQMRNRKNLRYWKIIPQTTRHVVKNISLYVSCKRMLRISSMYTEPANAASNVSYWQRFDNSYTPVYTNLCKLWLSTTDFTTTGHTQAYAMRGSITAYCTLGDRIPDQIG